MGVGAAQDAAMRLPGERQIIGEPALATQQAIVLEAGYGLAGHIFTHDTSFLLPMPRGG